MKNRRSPADAKVTRAGGDKDLSQKQRDGRLIKERTSEAGPVMRLADDSADKAEESRRHERSVYLVQTRTFVLFNLSAWACNHTLDFCSGSCACGAVSIIVQSFYK